MKILDYFQLLTSMPIAGMLMYEGGTTDNHALMGIGFLILLVSLFIFRVETQLIDRS